MGANSNLSVDPNHSSPYQATWLQQFRALLWRSWHSVIKNPLIVQVRLFEAVVSEP